MTMKIKNVASKLLTEEAKHVGRCSGGYTGRVKQETRGMFGREHVRSQATLTLEYISTRDVLTREARKHSRHVGT